MENQEYNKYNYASVWRRTLARIFDLIFISLISFSISLIFFINSEFGVKHIFSKFNENTPKLDGWRVFCIAINSFFIYFIYFCIIPTISKGLTLFKLIFKIRIFSIDKVFSLFRKIFKREILIWMLFSFFSIVASIIIWVSGDTIKTIQAIFTFEQTNNNQWFAWCVFIKTMFSLCGIISIILFAYMCFNNRKLAIQDKISNTFVYEYKINNEVINFKVSDSIIDRNNDNDSKIELPNNSLINDNKKWKNLQSSTLFENLEKKKELASKLNKEKEQHE